MSKVKRNCEGCGCVFAREVRQRDIIKQKERQHHRRGLILKRLFCTFKCWRSFRESHLESTRSPRGFAFFLQFVEVSHIDSCWDWTGGISSQGYGHLRSDGKSYRANRLAYTLAVGQIPEGMEICHRCDRPICCNPFHLFPGSHSDNMVDCVSKGRHRARTRPDLNLRGELSPKAKLSREVVLQIKDRLLAGERQKSIADNLPVSFATVSLIARGRQWGSVTGFTGEERLSSKTLSREDVLDIANRLRSGERQKEIAEKYQVKSDRIYRIAKGEKFSKLTGITRENPISSCRNEVR